MLTEGAGVKTCPSVSPLALCYTTFITSSSLSENPVSTKWACFLTMRGGRGFEVAGRGPPCGLPSERSGRLAACSLGESQLQAVQGQAEE